MSQSTTSDLVSTIATQLNIVIGALRLLVEMIQNPDSTSPADMTPGSCPSRPHASPASPLFRTTTIPSISWAPCEQPGLSLPRQKTPSPTWTSSAGKHTSPHHPSSPTFPPLPSPFTPPSSPIPSPSLQVADEAAPSSPPPLSFPPSPILSPPDFAYPPPSSLAPPPPPSPSHPAPSSPLPPTAPFPLGLANAALPLLLPLHPLDTTQTLLGMTIGAPKTMTFFSASNATKDFDPAVATSPQKWSAQSPRSALVGLNFSNYNGGLHHNLHLGLLPQPFRILENDRCCFFSLVLLSLADFSFFLFSFLLFFDFSASPQPLGPSFVSLLLLAIFK